MSKASRKYKERMKASNREGLYIPYMRYEQTLRSYRELKRFNNFMDRYRKKRQKEYKSLANGGNSIF